MQYVKFQIIFFLRNYPGKKGLGSDDALMEGTFRGHTRGGLLEPTGCPPLHFLKNFEKMAFLYSKRATSPGKTDVLHEKLKTVLC